MPYVLLKIVLVLDLVGLVGTLLSSWVMAPLVEQRPDCIFLPCPLHVLSDFGKYLVATVTFSPCQEAQSLFVMALNRVALVGNYAAA